MHPVVFSSAWFERYQSVLLGLLRVPVIGRELRDVLAIRRHDVGYDGRIVRITPHSYTVANPDGTFTTDVRTHAKYAKRLRYQLDGLWRAAHAWDQYVANPLVPALNVGFDTLTQYPDPGTGGTTCDGFANRDAVDESFVTIRAGAGTNVSTSDVNGQIASLVASTTTNQFANLIRGFFSFDTHALTASATIASATVSFYLTSNFNNLGAGDTIHLAGATPAAVNTLAASDYGNVQRTSFGSLVLSTTTTSAYNAFTLNASGLAAINKTGVTSVSCQNDHDLQNAFGGTWVSGGVLLFQGNYADQTGSSNDPKLEVTYSIPGLLLVKN